LRLYFLKNQISTENRKTPIEPALTASIQPKVGHNGMPHLENDKSRKILISGVWQD
jgi:hypothetical protein